MCAGEPLALVPHRREARQGSERGPPLRHVPAPRSQIHRPEALSGGGQETREGEAHEQAEVAGDQVSSDMPWALHNPATQ